MQAKGGSSTSNVGNHWVEIQVWGQRSVTYIGNYLEWTGATNTMKKYYYAGATRVAMREGSSELLLEQWAGRRAGEPLEVDQAPNVWPSQLWVAAQTSSWPAS